MRTKSMRFLKNFKPIQTKIVDDLNYYLGISVGENIVNNHLPTLSTDMLKTKNIIQVSEEEAKEWEIMSEANFKYWMDNGRNNDEEYKRQFYENLKWYHKLEEKYLPEIIKVQITKVKPTNIKEFKKGIEEALWDCDLSHYSVVDGFFDEGHEYGWYSEITLTRDIGKIPEKYL